MCFRRSCRPTSSRPSPGSRTVPGLTQSRSRRGRTPPASCSSINVDARGDPRFLSAAVRGANALRPKTGGLTMARERRYGILLGIVGLLLLASGAALAQSSEVRDRVDPPAPLAGETYIGPHVGYSFIGKFEKIYCPCDTDQNDFLFPGLGIGHFFADHFALEATRQYFRPDPDRIPDYWELTLGGLYDFTPSLHGWNTYVGFGGGASRQEVFKGKGVALAYLAAGSEYRFGKLLGLRLEVKGQYNFRYRFTETVTAGGQTFSHPAENPSHVDIQPTIGLLFHFGGRAAPPVVEVPPAPPPVAPAPPPPPAPVRDTIDFDHGKARVTNIAKAKLDAVALRLRDNPRATVTIIGYPDTGSGARQETLARQRAENVKQYLIDRHGIDASRISTKIDMTDTANRSKAVVVTIFP